MTKKLLIIPLVLVILFSSTVPAYAKTENSVKANVKPENPINTATSEELIKNNKKYNQGNIKVNTNYKKDGKFFLSGVLSDKKVPNEKEALSFLEQNKTLLGVNNVSSNFKPVSSNKDNLGYTHIKFNQYIGGLPVKDRQVVVHFDKQGSIIAINGDVYPNAVISKLGITTIGENDAIKIAKSQFKYNKLSKEPKAKKTTVIVDNKAYEAYEVNIRYTDPEFANWDVYVEANSGKIVDKKSNIREDTAITGSGVGVDGRTRNLNLYYTTTDKFYNMKDTTKPMTGKITTTSASHGNSYPGSIVINSTNIFNTEDYKASVDAHYYAGVVYDFYKNLFNRNSIDNNGMDILSTVHVSNGLNNAFWDGTQMVYGDGDGHTFTYMSGDLDVVAHEMTHGVTEFNGGLEYSGESGALNESYSDVFGVLVDSYNKYNVKNGGQWQFNAADWVVGDEVYTPGIAGDAIRSLANPTRYNQPDNMDNYVYTSDDNGGVHTNSGIPNKAAFLIAQAIGMEKTAAIYYRSYNYLNSTINFNGAAYAIKQAAADLYGSNSAEVTAVNTAFRAVKVLIDDPYEPNDTMETAYTINTGTLYQSYIASSTDVDYYKLTISSPRNIDINLTNVPSDYDVYLYDSSGNYLATSMSAGTSNEHINYNVTASGNYYIKVYGYAGSYNASHKYSLKVDQIVPRGILDTPTANAQVSGTMNVKGWFLDIQGVQKVEILVDGLVKGQATYGDARLDVYQAFPVYNNRNSGFHYSLNTIGISNGIHSIAFRGTNNSGIQTTLSTRNITVNNTPSSDTYESNNSIRTAYTINTATVYQSFIYSPADVDYYKFIADTVGNIEINLTNLPKDYDIQLANGSGTVLKASYADSTKAERISYNITSTGTYYIKVYGDYGTYDQFNKYSLRVDNLNSNGNLETPSANSTVSGNVNVRGWYLDGNGVAKVEVLVDGVIVGKATYGLTRTDVANIFPTYHNSNSGFNYTLDTRRFSNGNHIIIVKMTNNEGYTQTKANRTINIRN